MILKVFSSLDDSTILCSGFKTQKTQCGFKLDVEVQRINMLINHHLDVFINVHIDMFVINIS